MLIKIKNIFLLKKYFNLRLFLFLLFFLANTSYLYSKEYVEKFKNLLSESQSLENSPNSNKDISNLKWYLIPEKAQHKEKPKWKRLEDEDYFLLLKSFQIKDSEYEPELNSLNRSIVFDNIVVGPDIGWLVPPGLSWNKKFVFDGSVRGHNRRKKGQKFLGWNGGDAVGQFYWQPIHTKKNSFGLNLGVRSVYQGNYKIGGNTPIGDGLSLGFRSDRKFSNNSGMAIGAEQLLHFDGVTDTGRDLYLTFTKGWWRNKNQKYQFPLDIATAGFATGKMSEGNIKGLCSDLFGGAGTEVKHQRSLCWAPVFTLARVYNESFSTFFEYNSKWFLLGTSFAPLTNIPIRGTFAIQISDHINNYAINDFDSLKWVFRLSLGL